jgi:acyl-coenzyme A synthetase/AMP-(fatty) acid ligase
MYHQSGTYSYEQAAQQVDQFTGFLQAQGVKQGDTVCLMLPRTPELIISFLAATKIGAIPCPVNYLSTPNEIIAFIQEVSPKALVSSRTIVPPTVRQGLREIEGITCVDIDNTDREWFAWSAGVAHAHIVECPPVSAGDPAYYNFTTGSSGKPKGAITTHENIYWNTQSMIEMFNLSESDIHLCMFAAFAHPHELFARALYTGASVVLLQEINPRTIIQTINRYSVTCIM